MDAKRILQMDRVYIRDLEIMCRVGASLCEQRRKRLVVVNIALESDLSKAGRSDDLRDAVDYADLGERVAREVKGKRFRLIERLAGAIAGVCLADRRVKAVEVTVDKPGALRRARSAAVEIRRVRRG
jgi:dihydroneopterin aldolase/D-erythro-7,8-dihydroneopterin triphosphate epimerase